MDLRSIKPGLRAITHPTLRHPHTGEPLEAVGVDKYGRPLWPVLGASPDDDSNDDSDDDDDDEGEGDDDNDDDDSSEGDDDSGNDDDKDKDKKKGKKNPAARIKALEDEKDRHYKHLVAERKKNADLEARLKKLEEAGMKPEEVAERRKQEQAEKDEKDAAEKRALRVENAFLASSDVDWVDKEDVLAILLRSDEVEFDADGTVDRKSLRAALRRLAKAKPHLVKKAKSNDADDNDGDAGDGGSKSTAPSMNGKRKGTKAQPTREDLARRFPALNRLGK